MHPLFISIKRTAKRPSPGLQAHLMPHQTRHTQCEELESEQPAGTSPDAVQHGDAEGQGSQLMHLPVHSLLEGGRIARLMGHQALPEQSCQRGFPLLHQNEGVWGTRGACGGAGLVLTMLVGWCWCCNGARPSAGLERA